MEINLDELFLIKSEGNVERGCFYLFIYFRMWEVNLFEEKGSNVKIRVVISDFLMRLCRGWGRRVGIMNKKKD